MSYENTQNKWLNISIIVVAVLGIGYVAWQTFSTSRIQQTENPFAFNLEHYKNKVAPSYQLEQEIELGIAEPSAITITNANEILAAGSTELALYDSLFAFQAKFNLPQPATSIAFLRDTIYVASDCAVNMFSKNGTQLFNFSDDESKTYFTSIDVTPTAVFLADAGNRIIKKFNKHGELLQRIGQPNEFGDVPKIVIPSPYFDLAIDENTLWFVNPGQHMFESFTLDGSYRSSWQRTSIQVEGFSGCCNPTHFAILSDGSFVTSEKGLVRIKIHNQHGDFSKLVADADQFSADAENLDIAVDSQDNIYVLVPNINKIRKYKEAL